VIDLRSELLSHEVPIAFMVDLIVIITIHEPVLYQLFQVLSGHTGEGFGQGIPGDRYSWKIAMEGNIVCRRQHQMAEELILPPGVAVSIRSQGVIQSSSSNEVCGHTNIGFAFPWEDLPSLGWSGVCITVNHVTNIFCCPLLYHTIDPRWGD
jgi:hypothetical protein